MALRYHIIKAGAGSGKTRKLVLKFLDVLFRLYKSSKSESSKSDEITIPLNSILAITFTNAAADEMRKRVIKILKRLSIPELYKSDMEVERNEGFGGLLKTCGLKNSDVKRLVDFIIHNYSDLEIKTIDSFVNSLILSIPFSAGVFLTPQMETADSHFYISYACDHFIKKYGEEDRVKEIVESFIDALLDEEKSGDAISWNLKDELSRKARDFRKTIMNLAEGIDLDFYSDFLSKIEDFEKRCGMRISEVINTRKDEKITSERLFEAVYLISLNKFYPYIRIYKSIEDEIEVLKKKRRIIFIDELNWVARNIIKNVEKASTIFEKLGEKIFYFLIDEFQDTSRVQWENLFGLIENALSEGGEFFCVGDPKQAIYGFRGGEPELFEELFSKRVFLSVEESERRSETINENFRSVKEIIDFNNKIFDPENLKEWLYRAGLVKGGYIDEDTADKIGRVYADSSQKVVREENGFLFVKKIERGKKSDEDEEFFETIFKSLNDFKVFERFSKSDICFLLRKTEDVQKWTSFLLSKGIQVESIVTTDIRENFLLREIVEVIRFFDMPYDNFSFASFITGRLFEKLSGIDSRDFYRWLEKKERGFLYIKFKEEYRDFWDRYFSEPFRAAGYLPVYDFLIMVMNNFMVYELFPEHAPFLKHFEEVVHSLEEKGISTIVDFLKKWDKREEGSEGSFILQLPFLTDAVKVMTIHRAKGLQFPVVVLPEISLTLRDNIFQTRGNFIPYRGEGGIRFYYQKKELRQSCKELERIYREFVSKGLVEEINCLYVAMTRAMDELYLFLPERKNSKNLYISLILGEESEVRVGNPSKEKKSEEEAPALPPSLPPRKRWDVKFVREKKECSEIVDERRKRAMLIGEGIHLVLSKIKGVSSERELEEALMENFKMLLKNQNFVEVEEELSSIFPSILSFITKKLLRFFIVPSERVWTEKEVLGSDGRVRRIDRLIVFDDRVEVIDFKWGEKREEEHGAQLRDYTLLISRIYPDKSVKGFLIYLDSREVEESN